MSADAVNFLPFWSSSMHNCILHQSHRCLCRQGIGTYNIKRIRLFIYSIYFIDVYACATLHFPILSGSVFLYILNISEMSMQARHWIFQYWANPSLYIFHLFHRCLCSGSSNIERIRLFIYCRSRTPSRSFSQNRLFGKLDHKKFSRRYQKFYVSSIFS
jgi:hypothetical protein